MENHLNGMTSSEINELQNESDHFKKILLHPAIAKYKKWKKANPDEDYRCDEIFTFTADLGRGGMYSLFEALTRN